MTTQRKVEVIDEHTLARHKIRGANDGQEFERHRDCGGGAGTGNWRERSDFLSGQRGALATVTLRRPQQTRATLGRQPECAADVDLVSELSRLARAEQSLFRDCRDAVPQPQSDRERRAGTSGGKGSVGGVL